MDNKKKLITIETYSVVEAYYNVSVYLGDSPYDEEPFEGVEWCWAMTDGLLAETLEVFKQLMAEWPVVWHMLYNFESKREIKGLSRFMKPKYEEWDRQKVNNWYKKYSENPAPGSRALITDYHGVEKGWIFRREVKGQWLYVMTQGVPVEWIWECGRRKIGQEFTLCAMEKEAMEQIDEETAETIVSSDAVRMEMGYGQFDHCEVAIYSMRFGREEDIHPTVQKLKSIYESRGYEVNCRTV